MGVWGQGSTAEKLAVLVFDYSQIYLHRILFLLFRIFVIG